MIDKAAIKSSYSYNQWLERVNRYVADNVRLNRDMLPSNRKLAAKFEEFELDAWWYNNYKDFSRYASWHYLYAGLNCFFNYSKPCALYAHQYLGDAKIKSILDVGAGIGLSTMLLAELFPEATVYYNNIKPSLQADFFEAHKFYCSAPNVPQAISDKGILQHGSFDMLFASEYFEHFEEPMNETKFLLDDIGFTFLVVNNSFNVKAYGHFNEYMYNETLTPKQMSKVWLKRVRQDYDEMKIKVWNGRPKIFIRK